MLSYRKTINKRSTILSDACVWKLCTNAESWFICRSEDFANYIEMCLRKY